MSDYDNKAFNAVKNGTISSADNLFAKKENNSDIYDSFDDIMGQLFQGDKEGKALYSRLLTTGKIDKIKELWQMGGSPSLSYSNRKKDTKHPASYDTPSKNNKGKINIHRGPDLHSSEKLSDWIEELAHGIGQHNPAIMKLGVKEFKDKGGDVFAKNPMEPTYNFLQSLDTFPSPKSPSDSLSVYSNWWKSQQQDIPKVAKQKTTIDVGPDGILNTKDDVQHFHDEYLKGYTTEGHYENITHSRLGPAIKFWMEENLNIPFGIGKKRIK